MLLALSLAALAATALLLRACWRWGYWQGRADELRDQPLREIANDD